MERGNALGEEFATKPRGISKTLTREVDRMPPTFLRPAQLNGEHPLLICEQQCLAIRNKNRQQRLSQKREERREDQMELIYCNVRGINSKEKQAKIQTMLANRPKTSMLAMVETKLSKYQSYDGWRHLQTQSRRNGGCWIGAKSGLQ